jgi:hypothetical protein
MNPKETEERARELSKLFHIPHLDVTNDLEIRLWSLPGTQYPKCLMLRRSANVWEAAVYVARPKSDSPGLVQELEIKKLTLQDPNSGWSSISNLLGESKILGPFEPSDSNDSSPPIPDEGELLLEVADGTAYRVVEYRAFTKSVEAKTLFSFCSQMEREFNVSIGCFISSRRSIDD